MGADLDPRRAEQWSVVQESEPATGFDTVTELLFFPTLPHVLAVGVAKCDPDRAPFGSALPK
ncbi:hypothetical protein KCH_11850 [Kitasatospora cheerisanensis KCTC 2395]|uniref:Uncharacterized protein n=1 Tax=Kitasatospora cheerisanensis KCTC 2395 TaxID=1348663 RepID=A0A066ZAB1_9ACTN|nr:hypothetical protein KCH_11850 [Kitasatospora cheerisanensis KCTC 2395]